MRFELGEILIDKVTGFKGVAMGRTEYFTDCTHYGLQSQELKDGKPVEWQWFDETRLVKVAGARIIKEPRENDVGTSGEFPNAPQQ